MSGAVTRYVRVDKDTGQQIEWREAYTGAKDITGRYPMLIAEVDLFVSLGFSGRESYTCGALGTVEYRVEFECDGG